MVTGTSSASDPLNRTHTRSPAPTPAAPLPAPRPSPRRARPGAASRPATTIGSPAHGGLWRWVLERDGSDGEGRQVRRVPARADVERAVGEAGGAADLWVGPDHVESRSSRCAEAGPGPRSVSSSRPCRADDQAGVGRLRGVDEPLVRGRRVPAGRPDRHRHGGAEPGQERAGRWWPPGGAGAAPERRSTPPPRAAPPHGPDPRAGAVPQRARTPAQVGPPPAVHG